MNGKSKFWHGKTKKILKENHNIFMTWQEAQIICRAKKKKKYKEDICNT